LLQDQNWYIDSNNTTPCQAQREIENSSMVGSEMNADVKQMADSFKMSRMNIIKNFKQKAWQNGSNVKLAAILDQLPRASTAMDSKASDFTS
jgi:hypothetical protein